MRFSGPHILTATLMLALNLTPGVAPVLAQGAGREKSAASPLQSIAIAALDSAMNELREVESIPARVELADGLVNLLARRRPDRCRQFLDSLFESALQFSRSESSGDDAGAVVRRTITIAARFDRELARSYVDRYAEAARPSDDTSEPRRANSSPPTELYLKLATELVEKDARLAVSLAERTLNDPLHPSVLVFLAALREKDATSSNAFFLAALRSASARRDVNVNELLLLYSYVFSPTRVLLVSREGIALLQIPEYKAGAAGRPIEPTLAAQFLRSSAQVMLNPARYTLDPALVAARVTADLTFLKIIEPHVPAYSPALAEPLSAQQNVLLHGMNPQSRAAVQEETGRWNDLRKQNRSPSGGGETSVEALLKRADEAPDGTQKDRLYYRAATVAVRNKQYAAALGICDKLSAESRDAARQFVTFMIGEREARARNVEEAVRWARGDGDPLRRAYVLTLAADALVSGEQKDTGRATEILSEVEQLAAKLGPEAERISVLVGGAAVFSHFDNARASELLRAALKAADKMEGFTGDTTVNRQLRVGGFSFFFPMYGEEMTLNEVVRRQGRWDFNSTLADLRTLKARALRLKTVIALCGAVLS